MGDIAAAARYLLNNGGADKPYYVAGLRFKSRTGCDPFQVITDCTQRCVGENATGTGLPLDLPTGSGFYSLQPSPTWLFSSDPAVFIGSISYLHSFKRTDVSRLVLDGVREPLGTLLMGFSYRLSKDRGLNVSAGGALTRDTPEVSISLRLPMTF